VTTNSKEMSEYDKKRNVRKKIRLDESAGLKMSTKVPGFLYISEKEKNSIFWREFQHL
jgi:hypothetical protein